MAYYGPHEKLFDTREKQLLNGIYKNMKNRCYNTGSLDYKYYGGNNIKICNKWFKDKMSFIEWGLNNGYEEGMQIHRKDKEKDYCPDNCEFINKALHSHRHFIEDRSTDDKVLNIAKKIRQLKDKYKIRKMFVLFLLRLIYFLLGSKTQNKYAVERKFFRSKPKPTGITFLTGDKKGQKQIFESREQAANVVGYSLGRLSYYINQAGGYSNDGLYLFTKEELNNG